VLLLRESEWYREHSTVYSRELSQPQYSPILWWPSSYAIRTWLPSQVGHTLQTTWLVAKCQTPQHIINQPHDHHQWLIQLQKYIAVTAWWRTPTTALVRWFLLQYLFKRFEGFNWMLLQMQPNFSVLCAFLSYHWKILNNPREMEHWVGIGTQQHRHRRDANLLPHDCKSGTLLHGH